MKAPYPSHKWKLCHLASLTKDTVTEGTFELNMNIELHPKGMEPAISKKKKKRDLNTK